MRLKRSFGAVAVAIALALAAAACGGSGRSDDQSRSGGSPATTGSNGAASDRFGDLASPCGPAEGTNAATGEQGVTADRIAIGYGDDSGYQASAGLNQEMSMAVKAMIDWCNAQGGINGRTIDGTRYDAKITEVNNVWQEACQKEFFMVGQGFALDSAQEQTRRACGLPMVPGFAVSPPASNAPLKYEPLPVPAQYTNAGPAYQIAELFPEKVKKASVLYANYAATIDSKDKVVSAYPAAGWQFLDCPVEYNIRGESDWRPIVQRLKDCGAEVVYWSGSPNPNLRNALEAAAQLDYEPIWLADTNTYDFAFRDWNTAGYGDNVYFRLSFIPFEEADQNKATEDYIDIVEKDGGRTSLLGAQSASAFLLWASAVKSCGTNVTRQCVLDELGKVSGWTGGGLHSPADPGRNHPTDCSILTKLEGTNFVRATPTSVGEYECDPKFVADVTGPVLERAKLDADGIAQL